jgi:hypothetical protein
LRLYKTRSQRIEAKRKRRLYRQRTRTPEQEAKRLLRMKRVLEAGVVACYPKPAEPDAS